MSDVDMRGEKRLWDAWFMQKRLKLLEASLVIKRLNIAAASKQS